MTDPTAPVLLSYAQVVDDFGWLMHVAVYEIACARCGRTVRDTATGKDGMPEPGRYCSKGCSVTPSEGPKPAPPLPRPEAPVVAEPAEKPPHGMELFGEVYWLPRALEAACRMGVAEDVSRLARLHKADAGGLVVMPETFGPQDGRVRVVAAGMYATIGYDGTVLAFGRLSSHPVHPHPLAPARRGMPKASRGTHRHGPRTQNELMDWLSEEGCSSKVRPGGHIEVTKGDEMLTILPSTPSDHRSLKNAVAALRRAGLTLRK